MEPGSHFNDCKCWCFITFLDNLNPCLTDYSIKFCIFCCMLIILYGYLWMV